MRQVDSRFGSPRSRLVLALALATAMVVGLPTPAGADEPTITFDGGGWGHGVGLSQYGAQGMASIDGATAAQIISHYYTGASLATLPAPPDRLWVNLSQSRTGVRLINWQTNTAVPGVPITVTRDAETFDLPTGTQVDITIDGGLCSATASTGATLAPGSCNIDLTWDGDVDDPTTRVSYFQTRGTSGDWANCTQFDWNAGVSKVCNYSRGTMHVRPTVGSSATFNLVINIDVDDYVLGISEMPYTWHPEALKAQAIAARSYAIRRALNRPAPETRSCWCDIVDTPADQNYVGWGHGTGSWIAASNDTAGVYAVHSSDPTTPVEAFYSSSTFGHTESNEFGFGGAPEPYLRGVPDPRSNSSFNPNARWSRTLTAAEVASRLGLVDVIGVAVTAWTPWGTAERIRFTTSTGSATFHARSLRTPLGLKSPQILAIRTTGLPGNDLPTPQASVALHDPATGIWYVRMGDGNVRSFYYGNPADQPYSGDWNCDGVTTPGLYRVSTGFLFLRNSNTVGVADIEIYYGDPGDLPVAGDWDGDGCDTVGIYRPSTESFYLRNTNTQGVADLPPIPFGEAGDVPLAGDWDGDGIDTVGVYRPSTKMIYLTNSLSNPLTHFSWEYSGAEAGDLVIAGDWDGDGIDTVGLFRPAEAIFYLRDTFTQQAANIVVEMGAAGMTPVAGHWGT